MSKMDITKTKLYIREYLRTMSAQMRGTGKTTHTVSRLSDGFIYVISGSCCYTFSDGKAVTVSDGNILYLACGAEYDMKILTDVYSVIWCDFFFDGDLPRQSGVYSPREALGAEQLFRRIYRTYSSPWDSDFAQSISLLYKIYSIVVLSANLPYVARDFREKIREATDTVHRDFSNTDLSVAALAESAGVSEVYFRRQFKAALGCSPAQYIIHTRLKHAEALLEYDVVSVEDCAVQCGFSSVQYFCRVFGAEYGISPLRYRAKHARKNLP